MVLTPFCCCISAILFEAKGVSEINTKPFSHKACEIKALFQIWMPAMFSTFPKSISNQLLSPDKSTEVFGLPSTIKSTAAFFSLAEELTALPFAMFSPLSQITR